ncbi:MAG: hypothetical protein ACWA5Q_07015 [bacterium]
MKLFLVGLISISSLISPAMAGTFPGIHPLQSDRFSVSAGGFFSDIDGHAFFDSSKREVGTDIDMQDDLGMDDSDTQPSFSALWRVSERSRLHAEYFEIGSGGAAVIDRKIDWGDLDFQAGVKVAGDMDLAILRAFYGYSLIKDQRKEFGVGIGLHYLDAEILLSGEATKDGESVGKAEAGFDDWAVLPNIGAFANYALSDKWLLIGRVDWISAAIDKYEGGLWNAEGAIQYQLFRNFGVGVAYRYVALDIEVDEDDRDWGADINFNGPMAFFTANF